MGKTYTLNELAHLTGARVHGDPDCKITGVASLQEAQQGAITFLANPVYRKYLTNTQASAVILSEDDVSFCTTNALITNDPYSAYAQITQRFAPAPNTTTGIHPTAVIGKDTKIDPSARIEALAVIGDGAIIGAHTVIGVGCVVGEKVRIGTHSLLHSKVTLYPGVTLGDRVVLHSGVVVGSDGFGFAFSKEKLTYIKIYHAGGVQIHHDVEVGANTTIDRGALKGTDTIIEQQAKIDNQVQIAHNVVIGAYTVIAGCVGIAGSAKIGKFCQIGGATGIAGHIEIADNTIVTGMAMVTHSLMQPGGVYSSGTGVMENDQWRKNAVRFRHLDELTRRVQALEKQVQKQLEGKK